MLALGSLAAHNSVQHCVYANVRVLLVVISCKFLHLTDIVFVHAYSAKIGLWLRLGLQLILV